MEPEFEVKQFWKAGDFEGTHGFTDWDSTSEIGKIHLAEVISGGELPEMVKEKRYMEVKETVIMKREVNRCSGCRRKVGLTGFRCRCSELFCSQQRYSDRHDCSYDYKSAGREAITRENPVVKAAKIVRI